MHAIRQLFLLTLLLFPLFFLTACGKKGDPTLRDYEKPLPPAGFQAIHREQKIYLQWSYPREKEYAIAEFIILKSSGGEFEILAHIEKNQRSHEDTAIENRRDYRYKIIARSITGIFSDDSNVLGVSPLAPPGPPSDISFTLQGDSLVLAWGPGEKNMLYNVYKSLEKGRYGMSPLNSMPISGSSFTDSFTIHKSVYYTVRSLHGSAIRDESAPSDELAVDPSELVPHPPNNFRYHAAPERVFLYWDEPQESWVTRFRIYRKISGEEFRLIGETLLPAFIDPEPALTKRDYRLHAVGPTKEGPESELSGVISTAPPE